MDKAPKVCVVSPLYHPSLGGVGRQAVALTEHLRAEGVSLFVVCRRMQGLPEANFHPEVPVVRAWSVNAEKINLQGRTLSNLLISLSFSLSLLTILIARRASYDIAHFHGASLPLIVSILPLKMMGKRVVAKVAGARMAIEAGSFRGRYLFAGSLIVRLLRKVDAFIAISSEIRHDLLVEGYPPERVCAINNFVVPKDFFPPAGEQTKRELKRRLIAVDRLLLLYTGRLVMSKRLDLLLAAFKGLGSSGETCSLVILGDGDQRAALLRRASELGIQQDVQFPGTVANIRDYLHAADIFVFPSEREGMPNAVLEAMACGLPVIAARTGGIVDLIEDGNNGLLVDSGDAVQLKEAILRLLHAPDLRQRLSASAVRTIQREYSIERAVGRYIDLYERLLGTD